MTMSGLSLLRDLGWASCVTIAASAALSAQTIMPVTGPGGMVRLFGADAAVLESQEVRKDLPCVATPTKPNLGFDLKFHAGYEINVPLKDLAGPENLLTTIFRVTPADHPDDPVYFSQRVTVPAIEPDAKGDAYLQGVFDVGEGKYHVDWMMRDRGERVCSAYWDVDAELPEKDKDLALVVSPETVQPGNVEPFRDEPPVERDTHSGPLNVKVMVNFAPQDSGAATLQPLDLNALVSILRNIVREPRIGKFTVVAFNSQEQKVIYRQEDASRIDFPALGEALNSLNLGTVDVKKLSQKNGESDFLANLLNKEVASDDHSDAVIIAGPKVSLDAKIPDETLKVAEAHDVPVFYMNYNLNPQANPWRDAIGNAVRRFKGSEFTISRPRDLWHAWNEIISRIVKSKLGRGTSNASSQ